MLSELISIVNTPKLLSATQNENTKTRERCFRLKTRMLRKTGNTLPEREEYKLWPCQPLRICEERYTTSHFLCPATPTRLKCRLQAPHGNEAKDSFIVSNLSADTKRHHAKARRINLTDCYAYPPMEQRVGNNC